MIKARVLATLLTCLLLVTPPGQIYASAQEPVVSVSDLLQRSREMDGTEIRLIGEAVGDLMVRGDHAWVNILDASGTAIGVYLPKDEALKVRNLGRYFQKGDVIDLTGTFHDSCAVHDGEPDIHADSLAVVVQGHPVYHPVETSRVVLGGAVLALAGLMGLTARRRTPHPTR